jgi:hypothetical protein
MMYIDTKGQSTRVYIQRAKRALRGRLHQAMPVEGATQAPKIDKWLAFMEVDCNAIQFFI